MKKSLFFALFAFVAFAFVGCEPQPGEETNFTIVINQTELTLEMGESVKLNAIITPATDQAPVVKWTSDNPEVVTVNGSGIVEAVGLGTAVITATLDVEGVAPATCIVNVTNDAILNNFNLGGFGLFGTPEMIPGTDTVLTLSVGDCDCQLGYISLYVWDDNIVFVNGTGFSGEGFFFTADLPVYWITSGELAGYYVGNSTGFYIDSVADAYTAQMGELVDLQAYGDGWNAILLAETKEEIYAAQDIYFASQEGTQFFSIDWATQGQSYNYGNVKYANVLEDDSLGLLFDLELEWYDFVNDNRFYGLLTEDLIVEGDTTFAIVEPYDMRVINKVYSNMPLIEDEDETAESVLMPMKKNLYLGQTPELPKMDTKVMYKK